MAPLARTPGTPQCAPSQPPLIPDITEVYQLVRPTHNTIAEHKFKDSDQLEPREENLQASPGDSE